MAINYTANIQGLDPEVIQRGWHAVGAKLDAARERARLTEANRANMLLQNKYADNEQARFKAQEERDKKKLAADEKELAIKQAQELRAKVKEEQDAKNALEDRKRKQAADFATAHASASKAAAAGDMNLAHSIMDAVGAKPVVNADTQADTWAAQEAGTQSTAPVAFAGPEGQQVSIDPQAAVLARKEEERRQKVGLVFKQYESMSKDDPRIAQILDYTARRVASPGTDTDKALDDMGEQISRLYGLDVSEKNARRHAAAATAAKAPGTTIEAVANLDAGMDAVGKLKQLIKDKPDAWTRYQKNAESWTRKEIGNDGGVISQIVGLPRKALQVAGVADIAPEQGLRGDPEALKIHQGMEKMLTSVAKAFGGVITESDVKRAASQVATQGMDPDQAREYIQTTFDDLARKRGFYETTGRGNFGTPAKPTVREKLTSKKSQEQSDEDFINGR